VQTRDDQSETTVDISRVVETYQGTYAEHGMDSGHILEIHDMPMSGSEHCCFGCKFNGDEYIVRFKKAHGSSTVYRFNNEQYQKYIHTYNVAQKMLSIHAHPSIKLARFIVVKRVDGDRHSLLLEQCLHMFETLTNKESYDETHRRIVSTSYAKLRSFQFTVFKHSLDRDTIVDLQGAVLGAKTKFEQFILADLELLNTIQSIGD
jgi:hypothetical protein